MTLYSLFSYINLEIFSIPNSNAVKYGPHPISLYLLVMANIFKIYSPFSITSKVSFDLMCPSNGW
nr:MAG TPA: hypothetical protein [Caudoviricetes sp.]